MTTQRYARLALASERRAFVELREGSAHVLSGAPWLGGEATGEVLAGFDDQGRGMLPRLAPVEPRKILCVGRNYRAHAKELGNDVPVEPMLFYKPTTSLLDPDRAIELPDPAISARIEHEAELVVVVGRRLRRASVDEAREAVFGLSIACDVTARDLQKKDGQWWRAKGMDTFCPVGPVVVRGIDAGNRHITCHVNDTLRQDGHTRDMIFPIEQVLAHVSATITLEPGDVVLTGTPEGVGPLVDGDRLAIAIDGIGTLEVGVRATA
jgi:2-keto-4-pentenoate hydratase/2-oxohepta-3-ene-1,7-dioic acid hydratase in catechol pathway